MRQVSVSLPYGSESLDVILPGRNLLAVAGPRETPRHEEVEPQIRRAVREPVSGPPFAQLVERGQHLLILVDDLTRPTPVAEILPLLLDELTARNEGVHVTVLIALGTHRKMTDDEIVARVGSGIKSSYDVLNHEWDDEGQLIDLGTTENGTPIHINRLIREADVCIGLGIIVPHNLAGWSGGGKIVQPGICGKQTTYHTHLLAARCPTTNLGKLDNPVRNEIEAVATAAGLLGVVNVVLDRHAALAHVVAGESRATHRRGVELARTIWEVPVPSLADIVLVSSYPADIDFWQANKALYAAERIVKRGGDIILATPCPEGLAGQEEHVRTLEALAGIPSRRLYHAAREQGLHDYAALTVSDISARCSDTGWVTVVSDGLTDEQVSILGFERAPSVGDALEVALRRQGDDAGIVVLTHGGESLPVLRSGSTGLKR